MNVYCVYCLLFALGISSVYPTLWGSFVFDDGEAVLNNGDVTAERSGQTLFDLFKHDFWGVEITHPQSHKSYRPFTTLTFRWDYAVWGRNPFPFHLTNCIFHGLNCVLVYQFLLKCQFSCGKKKQFDPTVFWASVLFSVHPVHVEPLGGVVGRADLLSSFVFLIGFILGSRGNRNISSIILVTIAGIVGSLFKENAIVLILFYLAVDLLRIVTRRKHSFSQRICWTYAAALTCTCSFIFLRIWLQDGPPVFQWFDNPAMFAPCYFSKVSSVLYVWMLNIFILVCPIWLCYDWSMGCIDLITSPFDIRFGFTLMFLLIGIGLIFAFLKSRIAMISCLMFVITFLPSSNLIFTVGFVLAERNLYLPSIGYCLLLSWAFLRKQKPLGLVIVAIIFSVRSVHRSYRWTDQNVLFMSGLDVCPNNAKVHYNLGTIYGESRNSEMAIKSYKMALDLRPDYYQSMNNLGNILRSSGNLLEAEMWLRNAIKIKNDFAPAWMNLGIVLSKQNTTEAINCYRTALKHRHYYPDCEYNLGNLYLDMGQKDMAYEAWMKTISMKPTHSQAWINSLIILEQNGKLQEAKEMGIRASKILTDDDTLQFLMGNILGKLNENEEAKKHFENSITICTRQNRPVPSKYWSNLGVLYHRWGKKVEAAHCYNEALKLDSTLESAHKNLLLLKS